MRGLRRARAWSHEQERVPWAALCAGDTGRRWRTRRNGSGRRAAVRRRRSLQAAGGQKPPVFGPRASDAGKCSHPGNLQRSAAAATPSGRQNGGGGGLVLRGEPGPRDPRDGPRWPVAAPRPLSPPCPTGDTRGPWEGLRPPRRPSCGPWPLSRSPALPS